jgi:type II restriction enzyme and methylase
MSSEDFDKMRGGYYTPSLITKYITRWAISNGTETVLEPSCGAGNFIYAISQRMDELGISAKEKSNKILGIELYDGEAEKARAYGATIETFDFFGYYKDNIRGKKTFDVVLGNPPFIRYQNFEEKYRNLAFELSEEIGIKLNRLTNIWIPFLILSTECLKENGKLGMVIPAELFQVDYAAATRKYLTEKFEHLTIITFKKLLFEGTQEEVVILLGEKKSNKKGIEVVELEDASELISKKIDLDATETKELDHSTEKWVKYYLSTEELNLLRRLENDERLCLTTDLFETNVGVVSGQNKFFVMDKKSVEERDLQSKVQPIVGRAEQLSGITFSDKDFEEVSNAGKKVYLFTPDNVDFAELSEAEKKYIQLGEKEEYHKGYKCRIRNRWYIVPQSWKPNAFMLRQINRVPKIVVNYTSATNTDTLHKIRFLDGVNGNHVAAAFINSFTFAQCEITGRSYGGGVMTFEPGEVRKLRIPMTNAEKLDIAYLDKYMRENKIEEVLSYSDDILLKQGLGLSDLEVSMLKEIWIKLSSRRIDRKMANKL